jgi:WD40 repeat protein/mono/diheme cytochrome c family protein
MIVGRSFTFALAVTAMASMPLFAAEPKKEKEPDVVSYYRHIRPIFAQQCQGCHQPAKQGGDYVMTSHADLLKSGTREGIGVVPNQPDKSSVVSQIISKDGKPAAMPKGRDPLSPYEVALIKKWIVQGAKDDTPASAKLAVVDADHPPAYVLPPVITSIAYSPDGNLLAVAGYHEVLIHKADGSGLVSRLVGLSERIQSVAFSPDGKRIAVTGGSPGRFGEVQVWDVESKKLKLSTSVTADTIYGVSWSPDGSKIAFGCADNTLRAVEADTGKQVLFQGAHSDWVLNTTFSTDGLHLVSVSRDRSMKLTEVATQRFIDNVTSITPGALKGGLLAVARRPALPKRYVKSPPDPADKLYDELLVGGSDGVPRIYKMHREVKRVIGDDANKIREFAGMPGRIFAISPSADGNLFVAGSSSDGVGEARVYQVNDAKLIAKLEGQKGGVFTVAFRPDGKQVATAGFDGIIRLNDPMTGKLVKEFVSVPVGAATPGK